MLSGGDRATHTRDILDLQYGSSTNKTFEMLLGIFLHDNHNILVFKMFWER